MAHHNADDAHRWSEEYDAARIQEKWLPVWDELKPFSTSDPDDKRPRTYMHGEVTAKGARAASAITAA